MSDLCGACTSWRIERSTYTGIRTAARRDRIKGGDDPFVVAGIPDHHCRTVLPITSIRQYRFATPNPLQTRPPGIVAQRVLSASCPGVDSLLAVPRDPGFLGLVADMLVHVADGFRDRGVSVAFSYNPTPLTGAIHGVLAESGRKLPRQADSSKGDWPAAECLGRNVSGGTRPRLSWGRSPL